MLDESIILRIVVCRAQISRSKHLLRRFENDLVARNLPVRTIFHQRHFECNITLVRTPAFGRKSNDQRRSRTVQRHHRCHLFPSLAPQQPLSRPDSEDGPDGKIRINDGRSIQRVEADGIPRTVLVLLLDGRGRDVRLLWSFFAGSNGEDAGITNGAEDGVVTIDIEMELIVSRGILRPGVGVIDVVFEDDSDVRRGFSQRNNSRDQINLVNALGYQYLR
mmetsp:Transcript_34522/g.58571  ORF Transcript_34522/g.58571 Transcript_34522/m.58571 type:complete len:220 (+) Transcript_34522:688-1347(+)